MAQTSQRLCAVCTKIDFTQYFRSELNVRHTNGYLVSADGDAVGLGHLEEIYKRSNYCSFCWLAIKALCKRWWRYTWVSPQEFVEQTCKERSEIDCYIYSYLNAQNIGVEATTSIPQQGPLVSETAYRISIGTRIPNDTAIPYLDHAGDIQLSATTATEIGKDRLFHGRDIDPARVNISLARDWLSLCETRHGQLCEEPAFESKDALPTITPKNLFVLDVQNMCLCLLPQGGRYVALSYCWSDKNTFVATRSTVVELLKPGSLKGKMSKLSQVIQDAIHCVDELGVAYLWVDALCIIQDDEEQKRTQIYQMDRVYGSAVLTLICCPPDPKIGLGDYDGLPGYRIGTRISRQDIREVQCLSLLTTFPSVDLAISGSRWNSRAWTFQEDRLSRRKLFFTEMQLYFQCSCSVFCEDVVGEGNSPSAFFYPGTTLWNSSGIRTSQWKNQEGALTWLSRSPYRDPTESIASYSRLVDQYTSRQMSDPGDIINAFRGILSFLQHSMKTEFWVGLPEAYLDEALLWMEAGPHVRRTISVDGSTSMPFPSWSWAGWDTKIALEGGIFEGYIRPEVDWFITNQTGVAIQLTTPGSYNPLLQSQITSSNKTVRPIGKPPKEFLETLRPRIQVSSSERDWEIPRFLASWTSNASFKLTGETVDLGGYGGTAWEDHESLVISDDMGNFAGSIIMEQRWKAESLTDSNMFEFMLLSRSSVMAELTLFDEGVFPRREWCFINVMLIERDNDQARRLGVGVIHEDAWVKAKPVPMLIKLQ